MDFRELLLDAFGRVDEEMQRVLDGVDAEQLAFRPSEQSNTIAWLAWHLTRVEDDHVSELAGMPQAWIADGWHARFEMAADPGEVGVGDSAASILRIRADATLLLEYQRAVHGRTRAYVEGLTEAELDRVIDERWTPPVTAGVRLISVIGDCHQHVGQMALLRGLIEDRHWFPA